MSDRPLKLYWWNGSQNFGDAISRSVVEYVSGRKVEWAEARDCDLFAIGSIMIFARRAHTTPRGGETPWVWGSGVIGPQRVDFTDNVRFASVRGPMTTDQLGLDCWAFGDPGLLISDVIGPVSDRTGKIGVVPHHGHADAKWLKDLLEGDERFDLISPADEDPHEVVRRIAGCSYILSSSLHGLITADSYGIPNTWLTPKFNHRTPHFKFFDYALSVGRRLEKPVEYRDLIAFAESLNGPAIGYQEGIDAAKASARASFPSELVAA